MIKKAGKYITLAFKTEKISIILSSETVGALNHTHLLKRGGGGASQLSNNKLSN